MPLCVSIYPAMAASCST